MTANMGDIARLTEAIYGHEQAAAGSMYTMTFQANSGQGATTEAISHYRLAASEAEKAAIAAAAGNMPSAAAHEAASAAADALGRERAGNAGTMLGEIALGLTAVLVEVSAARGQANELVSKDDSSSAAAIHAGTDNQPEDVVRMQGMAKDIGKAVPDSRDTGALQQAADMFGLLRNDLDGASGLAQSTAGVAFDYLASLS